MKGWDDGVYWNKSCNILKQYKQTLERDVTIEQSLWQVIDQTELYSSILFLVFWI